MEKCSLRYPGHFHHRRDYHPYPRSADDVRFCGAHADSLPGKYWSGLHGPSDAEKPAKTATMKLATALLCFAICGLAGAQSAEPLPRFDGDRALAYTRDFVATGPRWIGSKGH